MGTVRVSDLINRAKTSAQDIDYVQWTADEWLDWLNECLLTITALRPDSSSETRTVQLVNGSRQSVPDDSHKLLDIICNTESGRAIRIITRDVLDQQTPNWHKSKGKEPLFYTVDANTPKTFYVYPAAKDGHQIDVVLSVAPNKITSADTTIPFDDWYAPAIVDYLLYRAYLKNAEFTNDLVRSTHFIQAFYSRLGGKLTSQGGE